MIASTLIKNAYVKIGKIARSEGVNAEDTSTAIDILNELMYSVDYMNLGYTEVTSGATEITTPAYAWKWMTNKLALELSSEFGALESYPAIDQQVSEGWGSILIAGPRLGPPQVSGNVPLGSGNRCPGDALYYTESDNGILTETNQQIIVEDGTP